MEIWRPRHGPDLRDLPLVGAIGVHGVDLGRQALEAGLGVVLGDRQHAAQCVAAAELVLGNCSKQLLLEIAAAWEKRAQEAERRERREG
jgi:hypothetical protein